VEVVAAKEVSEQYTRISVIVGTPPTQEIWELCNENHSYCPTHGRCPDILDPHSPRVKGWEMSRKFIMETMFFCEDCGMVKMINGWNNCSGLTEAKLLPSLP
jgi:hypothetical protein